MKFPDEKRSYRPLDYAPSRSRVREVGKYAALAVWILAVGTVVAWSTDICSFVESMRTSMYSTHSGAPDGWYQWVVPFWFGI